MRGEGEEGGSRTRGGREEGRRGGGEEGKRGGGEEERRGGREEGRREGGGGKGSKRKEGST